MYTCSGSIPSGRHYIGKTADPVRRLNEHNTKKGRWTSAFQPWELIALEEFEDAKGASARESFLKSWAGITERRRWIEAAEISRLVERP
ncbi:MAG: GIY-YIG nuclease family protein [Bryobacteraceae bacterium]